MKFLSLSIAALMMPLLLLAKEQITVRSLAEFVTTVATPCAEMEIKTKDNKIVKVVLCPKTHKLFHSHTWQPYDLDEANLKELRFTGKAYFGICASDIVGFATIAIKQGKTTFGYPYDLKRIDTFPNSDLVRTPVDGDLLCYTSEGRHFAARATYSSFDNQMRWHDPTTFELVKKIPIPDADSDFLYYRRQDISVHIPLAGGIKRKGPPTYYFKEYGIERARDLSNQVEYERDVKWATSLLTGIEKHEQELDRTSIKDSRKFYVLLHSGQKAFGIFIDDHKNIFSPITHAHLAVAYQDISGFAPISDGAYPENECYSQNEVADLYNDYLESRSAPSKFLQMILMVCSGIVSLFANRIFEKIPDKVFPYVEARKHLKIFFIIIVVGLFVFLSCKMYW